MKIVNIVLAAMFLLFAFVQINDPDPVLWILIYGSMAVFCVLAAFRYYYKAPMIILFIALAAYSMMLIHGVREWMAQPDRSILFDDIAKMQHPYVEEAREFLGIMICEIVLIIQLLRARAYKKVI